MRAATLSRSSLFLWASLVLLAPTAQSATFIVTITRDTGPGSLRQAMLDANADPSPPHQINFRIPSMDVNFTGIVWSIVPRSPLPALKGGIHVNGFSQNVAFLGRETTDTDKPMVALDGFLLQSGSGIVLSGDDGSVSGLLIYRFPDSGVAISRLPFDETPSRNVVSRNHIGISEISFDHARPNGTGISINGFGTPGFEAEANRIENNVISGNRGLGISTCDIKDTVITGNKIGTDPFVTRAIGNGSAGIMMACAGALTTRIIDNVIAFNGGDGINSTPDFRFGNLHLRNTISANSIYANLGLGINLTPSAGDTIDGVTANDDCDADALGSNFLQNFPELTLADANSTRTRIRGTLNAEPDQLFQIELFVTEGVRFLGEGQTLLTKIWVLTDSSCAATFDGFVPSLPEGSYITATATDPSGNTSEFGPPFWVRFTAPPPPPPPPDPGPQGLIDLLNVILRLNQIVQALLSLGGGF
jgi:parallel beta-helix repeat protein